VPLVRSRVQTPALPKKRKKKRERESNKVNLVKKKKLSKQQYGNTVTIQTYPLAN
jgi:hypothetical protein